MCQSVGEIQKKIDPVLTIGNRCCAVKIHAILSGVVSIAFLGVYPLKAQSPSGAAALGGTVLDGNRGAISAANVTLTEKSKELVRESLSGANGSFLFPSLSPGIYAIRVTKVGFSTYQRDDLRIEVGQDRRSPHYSHGLIG